MIVVSFASSDGPRLGVKRGAEILDATAATRGGADGPLSPARFTRGGMAALAELQETVDGWDEHASHVRHESQVRLLAPVVEPGKLLCVGLNYRRHAAESGMAEPKQPVLFSKFSNAIAGPDADVPIAGLAQVDYEAELALVIGKGGTNIPEADALSHVLGYCNANDVSERALQFVSGQWLVGKSLDGFLPLGPYLVTADEAGDPQDMPVRGWLNGELRQDSSTADMIFSVAEIIAYASRYMTLEAGDVICTGTPEGVVLGRDPKVWVQPGDEFVVEIGGLGRLGTRFVG